MKKLKRMICCMLVMVLVGGIVFDVGNYSTPLRAETTKAAKGKKELKLSDSALVLLVGQSHKLKAENTQGTVKWKSNKKNIASVNKKGKVFGKKAGQAIITATDEAGKKKCKVLVENPKFASSNVLVALDSYEELSLDGCSHEAEWESSNYDICDVDEDGYIKGVALGSATVTATVHGKTFSCNVTVLEEVPDTPEGEDDDDGEDEED